MADDTPSTSHDPFERFLAAAALPAPQPRLENHPVHTALIGPLMAGQVIREATAMHGVIVTRIPEA